MCWTNNSKYHYFLPLLKILIVFTITCITCKYQITVTLPPKQSSLSISCGYISSSVLPLPLAVAQSVLRTWTQRESAQYISVFWWLSRVRALVYFFVSSSSTSGGWYESCRDTFPVVSGSLSCPPLKTKKEKRDNARWPLHLTGELCVCRVPLCKCKEVICLENISITAEKLIKHVTGTPRGSERAASHISSLHNRSLLVICGVFSIRNIIKVITQVML